MKNFVNLILLSVIVLNSVDYNGSSMAPVVVSGAIIKAKHAESSTKKYKRSQCPVCRGKGWYISGDNIKKVDCGYCEPDQKDGLESSKKNQPNQHTIIHRK